MPTVSVVIPTFNRERFVPLAVDSVLRQGVRPHEIIVIDDGSTDGTRKALEPYAGRILYQWQKNSGVSSARNAGIDLATGDWVAFLDSDDEWTGEYLSTQMDSVARFPAAVAHITNAVSVFENGGTHDHFRETNIARRFGSEERILIERPFSFVLDGAYLFLQSCLLRRDVLLRTGLFDPGLTIAEDLDVMARMSLAGPFLLCNRVLVRICRREESIENLASQRLHRGTYSYQTFAKVYARLRDLPGLSVKEKMSASRELSSTWRGLGNLLLLSGKRSEARSLFWKSLLAYPSLRAPVKYAATFLPGDIAQLFVRSRTGAVAGEEKPGKEKTSLD